MPVIYLLGVKSIKFIVQIEISGREATHLVIWARMNGVPIVNLYIQVALNGGITISHA